MANETTSKHLIGATELTVVMPIKQGFIDVRDTVSYATRLRFLLRILNGIRKSSREAMAAREYIGPIESLRTINFVRFAIFDNDTKLLLAVSFDKPWEPYIRTIRNDAGPILDAICCHCVGYTENHRSELGYSKFAEWVRMHQVDVDFFFAAEPSLTTDDLRYLKRLESLQREIEDTKEFDLKVPELVVEDPRSVADKAADDAFSQGVSDTMTIKMLGSSFAPENDKSLLPEIHETRKEALVGRGLKALQAMHRLTKFYPKSSVGSTSAADEYMSLDEQFWLATAHQILYIFNPDTMMDPKDQRKTKYAKELKWFARFEEKQLSRPAIEIEEKKIIQGNILSGYDNMTHGCLLFIQFDSPEAGVQFLQEIEPQLTMEEDGPERILEVGIKEVGKKKVPGCVNLALTYQGLISLGLTESQRAYFPKEFREGMELRAGLLGDLRENHPDFWKLPEWNWPPGEKNNNREIKKIRLSSIDAVVQLQVSLEDPEDDDYKFKEDPTDHNCDEEHPLYDEVRKVAELDGITLLSVQTLRRKYKDNKLDGKRFVEEHFGFADGISQPVPEKAPDSRDQVSYGELLLGYDDDRGDVFENGDDADFLGDVLKDSSFLVVRKLRQYVHHFNNFLESQSETISRDVLLGKMMGRNPDGTPVAPASDIQEFDYGGDTKGTHCPFQSHIRRTNPRPSNTRTGADKADTWANIRRQVPRIMRRGFSYGPRYAMDRSDDTDRGLIFMAYNANIAEQFEVVQHWVTGGNSSGVLSTHSDPLLGVPPQHGQDRTFRFAHDGKVIRCKLANKPFVTLEWGMYLFVPSIPALHKLFNIPKTSESVKKGMRIIENLKNLEEIDADAAAQGWKAVLEERSAKLGGATRSVWAAIRQKFGGQLLTKYGLLIGSYDAVMSALATPEKYSVRAYWFRMKDSIGHGFLGMDPAPQKVPPESSQSVQAADALYRTEVASGDYQRDADRVNKLIYSVTKKDGYAESHKLMEQAIHAVKRQNNPDAEQLGVIADLKALSVQVMIGLGQHWFSIPEITNPRDPDEMRGHAKTIENYMYSGRYIFSSPNPTNYLRETAKERGKAELENVRKFITKTRKRPDKNVGEIAKKLFEIFEGDDEKLARTLTGLSNGLIAPTLGSFLSMMHVLITSERLWRLQQALLLSAADRQSYSQVAKIVESSVIQAMRAAPVPDIIHRTTTSPETCPSATTSFVARPGTRVVLGIESAIEEQGSQKSETDVLFGGDYDPAKKVQVHACPGREMGIGIIVGMLTAILDAGELSPENAPLTLSVDKPQDHAIP